MNLAIDLEGDDIAVGPAALGVSDKVEVAPERATAHRDPPPADFRAQPMHLEP